MNHDFEHYRLEESLYPLPDVGEKKRFLLKKDHQSELILMIWGAGSESPIHDHAGSECWTTILKGELIEKAFDKNSLELISEQSLRVKSRSYIEKENGVHQLFNRTSTPAYTLHLYQTPLSHCNAYSPQTRKWTVLENHYDLVF